jgi:hypothetical protein
MYRLLSLLLISIPFSLSAMIGFFDMDVSFDPMNTKTRSHIDIAPQSAVSFSDKTWLLSPRFSIYLDGSLDIALATGLRHTTPNGYLGHHVFWSVSQTKHGKFHQVGHSLDYLTPNWDFRINYYHPITKTQMDDWFLYSTHIWAESEVLWKGEYFNIGLGPRYNFTTDCIGSQFRFVVPFKYFNLGAILGYDYESQITFSISFSFSLYNSIRSSQLYDPIAHKSRVRYEKIELPVYNKAKEPKKEMTENLGLIKDEPKVAGEATTIVDPIQINETIPESEEILPPEPPQPTNKSWWSFFFDGSRNF